MMKKIFLILISVICFSCTRDDDGTPTPKIEENVFISKSENYNYQIGFLGDEDGVEITQQAQHFEISRVVRNNNTGEVIYNYKPQSDFIGSDSVELSVTTYAVGLNRSSTVRIVKIIFQVKK